MHKAFLLVVTIALVSFSALAQASMDPERGSCTPGISSDGWCNCTLVSSIDGSKHSGSIECRVLNCFDYKGWETDPGCQTPRIATCVFNNWQYAGSCVEQVAIASPTEQAAQDACGSVLSCLNNPLCVADYCMNTTIRMGWTLDSIGLSR